MSLEPVGCRRCGGGAWKILTRRDSPDGKTFCAICVDCGHQVDVPPKSLEEKPDPEAMSYDMRMFT